MPRGVRAVILEYFRLQSAQSAPPSATGAQLDRLRLGMGGDDGAIWRASQSADERHVRHADATLLLAGLDPADLEVCRLRYWCVSEHETHMRNVAESDLRAVQVGEEENAPRMLMTADGSEYVRPADVPADQPGEGARTVAVEGRVLVRETRAKLTPYEVIGARLGLTVRQVRSALSRAHDAIQLRIQEREP